MASQAKKKKFNPIVQIEREREIQEELDVVMEKVEVHRFGIPPRNKIREFTR